MATFGTHAVNDLLAATNQSVIDFGEDETWRGIEELLAAHNKLTGEKIGSFVEMSTDRQRRYGGGDRIPLGMIDEYGVPDMMKPAAGSTVGFPLNKYGRSLGWTYTYLEEHTPKDLVGTVQAVMIGDTMAIDLAIRKALFTPTNTTFDDREVDNVQLAVKALVNADNAPLPPDPYGNTFPADTHTHYLGTASLTAAAINGLIDTVVEHYATGRAMLYINRAQEASVRGMTGAGEFTPYPATDVVVGSGTTVARGVLDPNMTFNRAIGVFGANSAQVWVKPWIPNNYMFAYMSGVQKPLVLRYRNARTANLRLVYENRIHPIYARSLEREFGVGVWNRTNGAVLRTNNATYAVPTLAA